MTQSNDQWKQFRYLLTFNTCPGFHTTSYVKGIIKDQVILTSSIHQAARFTKEEANRLKKQEFNTRHHKEIKLNGDYLHANY